MSISKIVASGIVMAALFGASVASAQSYYPSYNYTATSGSCVNLSSTLSYGSSGTQVSRLQSFLVSQNYPGGGSWMVTGYFGQATAAAVRDFQQAHGLPQTGSVDSSTLAAINNCGGTSYIPGLGGIGYTAPYNNQNQYQYNYNTYPTTNPYTYTYPTNNNYNNNYNYNTGCGVYPYYTTCTNNYGTTPTLTSLSVTSATPGMQITAYGTGFDYSNNTVYVGGTTLSGIPAYGGTSLMFTVPANATNAVSVSVGNSHGTSNALTLTVQGSPIVCGSYPYNTNCGNPTYPPYPCGYSYGYPSTNCANNGIPTISYLSPTSGAVGTSVTVFGSGFSTSNNSVHFGNGIIANLSSFDGNSVSFTVPSTLTGYGYQPVGMGTYNVSVSSSAGVTSNSMPFTITSLGSTGAPTIVSVSGPTSIATNVSGTWSLVIQNPSGSYVTTSVSWGDTGNGYVNQAAPQTTYAQGQSTITFSHAYITSGTYTATFTVANQNGQQNTTTETIYVSGSGTTGNLSLTNLTPTSGRVGTQVMLQGNGFTQDNTVHFGVGGTMHVPSYTGTSIYYTIPSYVSLCDVQSGTQCFAAQQVVPGSYQLYVTNGNGTTQQMNFTVTQ